MTGTAGIEGLVLRYGTLYGPGGAPEMSLRGASDAKAKRELGWRPTYASWREGFAASLS